MSTHPQSPPSPDNHDHADPARQEQFDCWLCPDDARVFDALIEVGLDASRVAPEHSARAGALCRLLGLLDLSAPSASDPDTLIDLTLARVARLHAAESVEAVLVPDDEDALEALVAAGFDADRVPAAIRDRARRYDQLLSLLTSPVAGEDAREQRIDRTLARIQLAVDQHEQRMIIQSPRGGWALGRVRLGDLVSVAALLLIASALIGPMVLGVREHARRLACQTNMSGAAAGFSLYAGDYRDRLPMATPSIAGSPWWNVGQIDQSNSANLYVLTRTSHATLSDLACPGNRGACVQPVSADAADWTCLDAVSYSYQSMFASQRPSWNSSSTGRVVVLSDASPVVRRARRGQLIYPFENSLNHQGRGQSVLFNDGSVVWLKTPVLDNNDNIWLPRPIERIIAAMTRPTQADPIKGNETPEGDDDVMLGP